MNKSALKNFAIEARRELIQKIESKALKIGITEDKIKKAEIESSDAIYIDGKQLSGLEKKQREKLVGRIREIGYRRVIEEAAYTWFNRFTALRFMEVNNYLPTRVRVLSSSNPDNTEPDIIKEALNVDLDVDKEFVYELKLDGKTEELFKYLIIKQCNSLHKILPFMFETIEDYTEILFPEGILSKDSFLRKMTDTSEIPESDWEQVEIIGWLYQYYISEKKDQVFADLKKNIKISKENIPAATQLFTPNWIVRYMVENSLGRIWLESYPDSPLKSEWKYYLDEAEQEEEVKKKLEEIRYKNVNPEEVTFLDPCCGSGHILVYAFDVFYSMYLEKGYIPHEIPKLILEKNLFGLDIDDRAAQLAAFSVMMKAREKSRRVFNQDIKLNITSIQEMNWMTDEHIEVLIDKNAPSEEQAKQRGTLMYLRETFKDAKDYGSILDVRALDLSYFETQLELFADDSLDQGDIQERIIKIEVVDKLRSIIHQSNILINKFDVVCTNPPYMGSSGMNNKLAGFLKENFPNTSSDLSTVFMESASRRCVSQGYISMINIPTWMYLSSFEGYRKLTLENATIINLVHLGRGVFGSDFGSVTFVLRNRFTSRYKGRYKKLFDKKSSVDSNEEKNLKFFDVRNDYFNVQENFYVVNGCPIAYNMSESVIKAFKVGEVLNDICEPRQGLATGDNNYYLRSWYEVDFDKIGFDLTCTDDFFETGKLYAPYNKGGSFRKWYGNCEFIIKFDEKHYEMLSKVGNKLPSKQYYFKECLTWSKVTIGGFSMRYLPNGFVFDVSGCSLFTKDDLLEVLLGFLNSKVASLILSFLSPTVNYEVGHIKSIPLLIPKDKEHVKEIVRECINISRKDWDTFETSWGFTRHPLIKFNNTKLEEAYFQWETYSQERLSLLKRREEEINNIFIQTYGLESELVSEVKESELTIETSDKTKDIKSLISYSVGCIFGRYSLDEEGLIFAGGQFNPERYKSLKTDEDNILPILSGAYFEDDIVSRIVEYVEVAFSKETLNENLEFIAESLGKKDHETARETIRRYMLNDFYKDHVQTYKKRPIYWLFTSGKQKAFNCLIYMHRYDKTTLSRIRTDYVHPLQMRMEAERKNLLNVIEGNGTAREISSARKQLKDLDKKIEELKEYEELLHHKADMQIEIDLDDGVVVNYAKFEGLLAKI